MARPDTIDFKTLGPAAAKSLQGADIGRDSPDLCLGQLVRNWLHDRRGVGVVLVLAPLLVPVRQFPEDVVMKLTRQAGKCVGSLGVRPVTGSARRNISAGNSLFIDFLSCRFELLRSSSQ